MLRNFRIAASFTVILLLLPNVTYAHSKAEFHDAMRKLWEDHVTWTRLFIISAAAGLPDQDVTTQRLLDNQTDIGNAVAEFYGRDAGDKLTALGVCGQISFPSTAEKKTADLAPFCSQVVPSIVDGSGLLALGS